MIKIYTGIGYVIETNKLFLEMPEKNLNQLGIIIKVAQSFDINIYTCSPIFISGLIKKIKDNQLEIDCEFYLNLNCVDIHTIYDYFSKQLWENMEEE